MDVIHVQTLQGDKMITLNVQQIHAVGTTKWFQWMDYVEHVLIREIVQCIMETLWCQLDHQDSNNNLLRVLEKERWLV